jgi:hypothetical protein
VRTCREVLLSGNISWSLKRARGEHCLPMPGGGPIPGADPVEPWKAPNPGGRPYGDSNVRCQFRPGTVTNRKTS